MLSGTIAWNQEHTTISSNIYHTIITPMSTSKTALRHDYSLEEPEIVWNIISQDKENWITHEKYIEKTTNWSCK